jgi:23S rRNA (pseudouridine1915-N3)-methyltransferase
VRLLVLAAGRGRGEPAQALFDEYVRRLPWQTELKEIVAPKGLAGARLRTVEAALLLKALPEKAQLIALDGGGEALSSESFAKRLGQAHEAAPTMLAFAIGGADGLGADVMARAAWQLSLGPMTWPHLLVRAMLAEQLYRAASILAGHPYHRA